MDMPYISDAQSRIFSTPASGTWRRPAERGMIDIAIYDMKS
jgi:hypothetical protein